ncbi:MAG: carbohydrate kinase family protein [Planctomycetota bacterium]|jgi:sugar/nucleoside kinase (ribokinase family)
MDQRQADAVVAGHVCLDITPMFGPGPAEPLPALLRPGGLVRVEGVQVSPGGAVGNTGPALQRLGIPVALMARCGRDALGQVLLKGLERLAPGAGGGIRLDAEAPTSYTIVLAPPGIDRMFVHCPGANDSFGPEDVDLEVVARARLFHLGYPPLMRRMYAGGGTEAAELLRGVAGTGGLTSVDLSLPDPDTDAGRADWPAILARILPHVDLFLPSLDELLYTLERQRFGALSAGNADVAEGVTVSDLRRLAGTCLEMGASVVVIKCGRMGAYMRTGRLTDRLCARTPGAEHWEGREIFEPSCQVDEVANATGAGDAAVAGFLAAYLRGQPPERCMAFLTALGAQNLAGPDAVSALKTWEETEADLAAGLRKNPLPPRLRELAR